MTSGCLYLNLASELLKQINSGAYEVGDKLMPVRKQAAERGMSVSTVLSAYYHLERTGVVESRAKSGFYVKNVCHESFETPEKSSPDVVPKSVTGQEMVLQLIKFSSQENFIKFGAAVPTASFIPVKISEKAFKKALTHHDTNINNYVFPPGYPGLRKQILRRMHINQCNVNLDDILITNGCQEALSVALQACAKPGDIIAIESPAYYGLLQLIESLNMKALEIPTDPKDGISIEALELAVEQWSIKVCVVSPSFSNPLGVCMPEVKKQRLVQFLSKREIPIIEDDVYGELSHDGTRPLPLKAYDKKDWVIYCSSFSKTFSPGVRIGWIASNRFYNELEYLKYVSNLATPTLTQIAMEEVLASGKFDSHLQSIRNKYAASIHKMTAAIIRFFPVGTKITKPKGGFLLWIELPFELDTFELANRLNEQEISIAPGKIFSVSDKYSCFMRLSCAVDWNLETESALQKIAGEIHRMSHQIVNSSS